MQPDTKVKENGQAREFTPTEQWDQLAFQVLYRELAPKGFKKVTGGSYKGQIIAVCDGPGLPKSKVTSAQKIAAQLIRGFRDKSKAEMNKAAENLKTCLKDCKWYEFSTKRYYKANIEAMQTLVKLLDNVSIK